MRPKGAVIPKLCDQLAVLISALVTFWQQTAIAIPYDGDISLFRDGLGDFFRDGGAGPSRDGAQGGGNKLDSIMQGFGNMLNRPPGTRRGLDAEDRGNSDR